MNMELSGRIAAIYISPSKAEPMRGLDKTWAIAGVGLWGDRYASGRGAYSVSRNPKVRHVSLIGKEAIDQANEHLDTPFSETETRRNLLTEGVDLNALVGKVFWVGNVAMRGTELCDPCKRPEKLYEKPGFEQAFQGLGGLRAEILTSGLIAIHDEVTPAHVSLEDIPQQTKPQGAPELRAN